MKSILWKELRENAKWALLALAVLTLAQCFALASGRSGQSNLYNNVTIMSSMFLMVTSFGSAFAGAALGALQVIPEQTRDQWASLLHRPAGRGVIFVGKAIAGSLLVLLATGLPFFISVIYIQIPGQFAAPLVPGMITPGFSDLFLGLAFYFASLAVCLNRGKWWGARGIMAFSLLPVFVLHVSGPWPILGSCVAASLYALTAWGAMAVNGPLRERPRLTRLACVSIILVGSCAAVIVLCSLLLMLPFLSKPSAGIFKSFQIGRDGTILASSWDTESSTSKLTDLDGNAVTEGRYASNDSNEFLQTLPVTFSFKDLAAIQRVFLSQYRRNLYRFLRVADKGHSGPEVWFYLVDQHYFLGYDKLSRRTVGSFGRDGFLPAGETPRPFATDLMGSSFPFSSPHLYAEGPQIYQFGFGEREMTPLFHAAEERIVGFNPVGQSQERQNVAVALEDTLHILQLDGKKLAALPYRRDPFIWGVISVAMNPALERIYVQYNVRSYWVFSEDQDEEPRSTYLEEYSSAGDWIKSYQLPANFPQRLEPGLVTTALHATTPFALAGISTVIHHFRSARDPMFPRSAPFQFQISSPALILSLGYSVVMAIVAWFWALRVGFSPKDAVKWSLFVFCFGLPGLLAFRLAASWPTRVECPHCNKPRSIEVQECSHCQSPWTPPPRTGQEIFG